MSRDSPLGPISATVSLGTPRPRKARVRRDFKSNVNTRVSSSFPFSVLLASPETLITPGNNRGNSWSTGAPPKLRPLCSSKVQSASLRFRTIHDAFPDSHKLFQAGCVSGWGRGGGGAAYLWCFFSLKSAGWCSCLENREVGAGRRPAPTLALAPLRISTTARGSAFGSEEIWQRGGEKKRKKMEGGVKKKRAPRNAKAAGTEPHYSSFLSHPRAK